MNPTLTVWLHLLGATAAQTALVVLLAAAVQQPLRSARWRHAVWLAAFLGVALVLTNALFGWDRQVNHWLNPPGPRAVEFIVRGNLPAAAVTPLIGEPSLTFSATLDSTLPADTQPLIPPTWWPAWLWLAGALGLGVRTAASRLWLVTVWLKRQQQFPAAVEQHVAALARSLGFHRRVRVVSSDSLLGPIAFGWVRPTIALPADFWSANSPAAQDAMLLHELAHLAARDPLWLGWADLATALLWWHPLIWWARHQFRAACESAADEASLLVDGGPALLADCLVTLAARLQPPGVLGLLGMAGFRSGLGRRVERLLSLPPGGFHRPGRGAMAVILTSGSLLTTALALLVTARAVPVTPGEPTLFALAQAAIAPAATPHPSQPSPQPATSAESKPSPVEQGVAADPAAANHPSASLLVQLTDPAASPSDRRTQLMTSMDVLARRLFATGRFDWLKCEPLDPGQFRVVLRAKPADTSAWDGLTDLIEQRGWIEFRRVHPESQELASQRQCPIGYEPLIERAAADRPARTFIVEMTARAGVTSQVVEKTELVKDPLAQRTRVSVRFTSDGAERLRELTAESVGHQLAVVLDGKVLMAPRIRDAITGGACEISGDFTEAAAAEMAALLQAPLPTPLKVVETKVPASTGTDAEPPPTERRNSSALPATVPSGPAATPSRSGDASATPASTRVTDAKAPAATAVVGAAAPATSSTNALYTRTFKLDPQVMQRALESLKTPQSTPPTDLADDPLRRLLKTFGVEGLSEPQDSQGNEKLILKEFETAGYKLSEPRGFWGSERAYVSRPSDRKALFFNQGTGMLLVRATLAELDTVEQILQTLNSTPPQVVIEAKFVEITDNDSQALGFDWFLGNTLLASSSSNSSATNGQPITVTGILSDPQFRAVSPPLFTNGPPGVFPGQGSLSVASAPVTNGWRELTGDQLDWAGKVATNAANIRVATATGATVTGILSDPQFRAVLRALEKRGGVDVLSAPKVTTISGRPAQIQVSQVQTIATGINPMALVQPGAKPGTNVPPLTTGQIPSGPVLDVIPYVSADGYTVQLTVIASVTEFLGYDHPPTDAKARVWQDGKPVWVDTPLPRFRVREVQSQATIWDGQTLALGGITATDTVKTKDKVPVLGDIPLVGLLFRSESQSSVRKRLVVFITATIIDPAGNRVHTAENLPYDPNRVPRQPNVLPPDASTRSSPSQAK